MALTGEAIALSQYSSPEPMDGGLVDASMGVAQESDTVRKWLSSSTNCCFNYHKKSSSLLCLLFKSTHHLEPSYHQSPKYTCLWKEQSGLGCVTWWHEFHVSKALAASPSGLPGVKPRELWRWVGMNCILFTELKAIKGCISRFSTLEATCLTLGISSAPGRGLGGIGERKNLLF